jgi:hypothetical protein
VLGLFIFIPLGLVLSSFAEKAKGMSTLEALN